MALSMNPNPMNGIALLRNTSLKAALLGGSATPVACEYELWCDEHDFYGANTRHYSSRTIAVEERIKQQ